ncbi:hypothetical protein [Frigoribacterium sp. CG_9.8]|uniref:hypothetical protein n=1 Tax=Frigoribacterium sp. CG_9.8 TaxID=2787733 RepID=UPI0018CA65FA|nr:hypothetical protein [Frigoribacterium sp. CG_9.8]MBG6106575.1 hypothetical protein [Frigoribacterium sp. CG_9.8]
MMQSLVGKAVSFNEFMPDLEGFDAQGTVTRVNVNYVYVTAEDGSMHRLDRTIDSYEIGQ